MLKDKKLAPSEVEIVALILQNCQYPRNAFKKTGIENGSYVSVIDEKSAKDYIEQVVCSTLDKALNASIALIAKNQKRKEYLVDAEKFNKAEDLQEAANILKGHKKGRGDIGVFLEHLQDSMSVKTMDKIKMLAEGQYSGETLFKDKNPSLQHGLSQKKIFNLWRYCVRKQKLVSEDEFFNFFLNFKHKLNWWKHYYDENGDPIIRQEEETRAARRGKKAKWRKRKHMN